MKFRAALGVLALSMLSVAASCPNPPPNPTPTPTPPPSPPPSQPLVAGPDGRWTRDGKPWQMRMVIVCCDDETAPGDNAKDHNWPLTDRDFINWITFHKQNATHIRLGPHSPIHEGGSLYSAYAVGDGGRVNLDAWNAEFWDYADGLIAYADEKGVIVEVDLTDVWVMQHQLSPWCAQWNLQGANVACGLGAVANAPPARVLAFVAKAVAELGDHPNVIWQDGNEAWKGMSSAWTAGLRDQVRRTEQERGYIRHPFGSNSGDESSIWDSDYATFHGASVKRIWTKTQGGETRNKPVNVNEYDTQVPNVITSKAQQAQALGTGFGYWMGGHTEGQRGAVLIALEAIANNQPNPIPTPEACPNTACIHLSLHNWIRPDGGQGSGPEAGGRVVIDSTPLFQKCGPRGRCNDEFDEFCGGRKCEPPDGPGWRILEAPPGSAMRLQNTNGCGDECPNVPCRPDRGYQAVINLHSGHYKVEAFIDGHTDCEGKRLTRATGLVEFDVP